MLGGEAERGEVLGSAERFLTACVGDGSDRLVGLFLSFFADGGGLILKRALISNALAASRRSSVSGEGGVLFFFFCDMKEKE